MRTLLRQKNGWRNAPTMAFLSSPAEIGALGGLHRAFTVDTHAWSLATPLTKPLDSFVPAALPGTQPSRELTDPGGYHLLNQHHPRHVRDVLTRLHDAVGEKGTGVPVVSVLTTRNTERQLSLQYSNTEPKRGTIVHIRDSVGMLMASNWKGDQFHAGVVFFIAPWDSLITVVQKIRAASGLPEMTKESLSDVDIQAALMTTFHGQDRSKEIRIHRKLHEDPEYDGLRLINEPQPGVVPLASFIADARHVLVTFSVAEQPGFDGKTRTWIRTLLGGSLTLPLCDVHLLYFYGRIARYVRANYFNLIQRLTERERRSMPETLQGSVP
jgi:hypothetical protein